MALLVPIFWVLSGLAVALAWHCSRRGGHLLFAALAIAISGAIGSLGSELECSAPLSCDTMGAGMQWFRVYSKMSAVVFGVAFLSAAQVKRAVPASRLSPGLWLIISLCGVGAWAWTAALLLGLQYLTRA